MSKEMISETGVTITVTYDFNSDAGEDFLEAFPETLKATAEFEGFRDITVFRNGKNPRQILYIQRWDSEEAFTKYVAWRSERGDMDALAGMISKPPTVEFWPTIVTTAVSTLR